MGKGTTGSEGLLRQLSRRIQNAEAQAIRAFRCNESGVKLINMKLIYAANPGAFVFVPANVQIDSTQYMTNPIIPPPTAGRSGFRNYFYAQIQEKNQ